MRQIKELISEEEWCDGVVLFDNPSYDSAFLGITEDGRAVYEFNEMVEWRRRELGERYDEAMDVVSFNSSFHEDGREPLVITMPLSVMVERQAENEETD